MIKKAIKIILDQLGYAVTKQKSLEETYSKRLNIEHIFKLYFQLINLQDFFFMQIGANNDAGKDPIHKFILRYNLKGILIEPQKEAMERIKANFGKCDRLYFANVAVANKNGYETFYTIKNDVDKYIGTGGASFNKDMVRRYIKNRIKKNNVDKYIKKESVKCLTLDAIANKYNIVKIDFLQIDAEGYDFEIIKMFDFQKFSPLFIHYESKRLQKNDKIECEKLLIDKGYILFRADKSNTGAIKVK